MTDVFLVLEADHREVQRIIAGLEAGSGDAQELADKLVVEESKHEAAEEMYFWPTVHEKVPTGQQLAAQGLAQEQECKEVLDQLRKTKLGDPAFAQLTTRFARVGGAHMAFEEMEVWPSLRAVLSPEEAARLGTNIETAKKSGPTRPHPNAPRSPGGPASMGVSVTAIDDARDATSGRR